MAATSNDPKPYPDPAARFLPVGDPMIDIDGSLSLIDYGCDLNLWCD
jgi:hypothetical protein